jgi:arylsulfatase A-like enzyme
MSRHYGIRTEKYKLIHYYDQVDSWELYDLQADPMEMSNLIEIQDLQVVVADLKIRLRKLQERYKDDMVGETRVQQN